MIIDPPLPSIPRTSDFVGEETTAMPTRPSPGPSPHRQASSSIPGPDPSVWSEAQQQQLMQAIMGNMAGMPGLAGNSGQQAIGSDPATMPLDNPLAAMLMGGQPQAGQSGGVPPFMPPGMNLGKAPASAPRPKSRLQKMLPLVHLVALWSLLAYFVIYVEPRAHGALVDDSSFGGWSGILTRWAELAKRRPQEQMIQGWSVAAVVGRFVRDSFPSFANFLA